MQLSTQAYCDKNAGDDDDFLESILCICDDDYEDFPTDVEECDATECNDKRILQWDIEFQQEFCNCNENENESSTSKSSAKSSCSKTGEHLAKT